MFCCLSLLCVSPLSPPFSPPLSPSPQERDGFGGPMGPRGRGRGRGDWSMAAPGGLQEGTYTIPADKCGLVIGKGRGGWAWGGPGL